MTALILDGALRSTPGNWRGALDAFRTVLSEAVDGLNSDTAPRLIARLRSEELPAPARRRSAVNTRIGVLLEYSLGAHLNKQFRDANVPLVAAYVVSNRFPDIVVRDLGDYRPLLRLEIKCIHRGATERSANFDTPLNILKPASDLLVVLFWTWQAVSGADDRLFARIELSGAFDAYVLARARDLVWVNDYRASFGQAPATFKAIDFRGPLIRTNRLKPEEGNLGKLTRIAAGELPDVLADESQTVQEYRQFVAELPEERE